MAEPDETPPAPRRRHRGAVYALLAAGTITLFLSIAAIWISRQALETDSWTDTSSQLLEDEEIRAALSAYLVDQLYTQVDVPAQLREALPPRAAPLAGPAAGALRDVAERGADEALGRPRVQALWEDANRAAHEQLLVLLEGGGERLSTEGGVVALNLDTILRDLAERTGIGARAVDRIPPDAAQIEVLRSDQLELAQDVADLLKPLAAVLVLLALAFFGGAIALSGDRRRETLRAAGFCFIFAGAFALLARSLAGNAMVDALATTEAVRPATESVWEIGTSLLSEVAAATILYGVVFVFAAWLAGQTRAAVGTRRALAPYLREPAYAWAGIAAIALLVVWWEPTPGTRRLLPALLLLGLLIAGVLVLRRQTAREFPDAPEPHPGQSIRDGFARLRASARRPHAAGAGPNGGNGELSTSSSERRDALVALEHLATLHDRGALTDEEFADQKRELLAAR